MLKIIDKIHKDDVFESVPATSKEELLDYISEKISERSGTEKGLILNSLVNREAEESTGIGHSIAIPHGKIAGFGKTAVYAFILEEEIDYEALDDQYVRVVFALIADEKDATDYVETLSQLIFVINQKDIMNKIVDVENGAELLEILDSAKNLETKYETEGQIKYLIELQRADSQIYMYELWESTHEKKNEILLDEYLKYKSNLEKKIDEDILSLYRRISDKYSGRALSKIDNYTCSACHIAVPKVTVNEVRRQNQIITCFNCGRILFTL